MFTQACCLFVGPNVEITSQVATWYSSFPQVTDQHESQLYRHPPVLSVSSTSPCFRIEQSADSFHAIVLFNSSCYLLSLHEKNIVDILLYHEMGSNLGYLLYHKQIYRLITE